MNEETAAKARKAKRSGGEQPFYRARNALEYEEDDVSDEE